MNVLPARMYAYVSYAYSGPGKQKKALYFLELEL